MNDTNHLLTELRQHRQWVCHTAAKLPLNPRTGYAASSTNSQDWGTYEEAVAAATAHAGVGIGFVLTERDNYVCIDLDSYKTGDPAIVASHEEIKRQFSNTYSERSPNGGTHIWGKGSIPRSVKSSQQHIEIYDRARYMTFTGNAINNMPLASCNGNLTRLFEQLQSQQSKPMPTLVLNQPQAHADDDLCRQAANASNGGKFIELWNGRWQQFAEYPSQSEADQALNNIIAFYTDDPEQVARVFRASALGQRDKAKRNDYVGNMVRRAFDQKTPMLPSESITAIQSQWPAKQVQIQNVPLLPIATDIEVVSMSSIPAEPIEWLWNGFLPKGKLTLLAGAAGTGKSTLAFAIAAVISRGGIWPDGAKCTRAGHTLIWSSEDDPSSTIVPRLMAMGADLSKIHSVKAAFNPAKDMPLLQRKAQANGGIDLLILDPIVSAIEGDMNKSNEVRRGLQAVVDFASELKCGVIGISHFAKGTSGRNPAERVIGSVAFGAFARVVLVAAKDEETEKRVLVVAKSNISKDNGGFYYAIQVRPLSNGIEATCIDWGGAIEGSSREILATVEHQEGKDDNRTQNDEAKTFLVQELKNGPRYARELIESAHSQLGIREKTLQRARQQLGILTINEGANKGWKWSFPTAITSNTSSNG